MIQRILAWLVPLGVIVFVSSCAERENAQQETVAINEEPAAAVEGPRPLIAASNYPVEFLTSEMIGDAAEVWLPVPSGEDPAYWKPAAADIEKMQSANLIILNGAGYEKWLPTVTLPENKMVDTAQGFSDQWITDQHPTTHSHGPGGEHTHGEIDFNTWLDLDLALRQAEAIKDRLVLEFPAEALTIQENFQALKQRLLELDLKLEAALEPWADRPVIASHPVYSYLARAHGIADLESLHWEPLTEPSDEDWKAFDALLSRHRASWMLWEGEPSDGARSGLEERGITPIVFITGGARPDSGDYVSVMEANIQRLTEALDDK
ncbi:MAG: metal ABC transporter substrate-binding protein [Acidobacteriota bacterium]